MTATSNIDIVAPGGGVTGGKGSQFKIGDGTWATAGHLVMEFNEDPDLEDRDIKLLSSLSFIVDIRDYRDRYQAIVDAYPDNSLPSYSSSYYSLSNRIESQDLYRYDMVFVIGGGQATNADPGMAVFLDAENMTAGNSGFLSSATFSRYGQQSDDTNRNIIDVDANGFFEFEVPAMLGDSGGSYVLDYGGREYYIGIQSANAGIRAIGTYWTYSEWFMIHRDFLAVVQTGDVTLTEPHNLVVGTNSADTFSGSYRADRLLGRDGNDTISDGDPAAGAWADDILDGGAGVDTLTATKGNDTLIGGFQDDTLVGGEGSDTFWGGGENDDQGSADGNDTVDYSSGSAPISVDFNGTTTSFAINVDDGTGATDVLHSIEKIVGTPGFDKFSVAGYVMDGIDLTFDAHGGQVQSLADLVSGRGISGVGGGIAILIDNAGNGHIGNKDGTGGQITLTGFHTQIVASDYDDSIIDDSAGSKWIDGGAGDDTISTSGTSADVVLYGGWGSDTMTGGAGNDVIDGGSDGNGLFGGDGDDLLTSDYGYLNGGAGNDYLRVYNHPIGTFEGGAGNDFIDVWGAIHLPYYADGALKFAEGDGHDTILGHYVSDPEYRPNDGFDGYTLTGIRFFDLSSLSFNDVEFVWDATLVQANSASEFSTHSFYIGDLAVVIKATGESIFIPGVSGEAVWTFYGDNPDPRTDIENSTIIFYEYNFLFEEGNHQAFGSHAGDYDESTSSYSAVSSFLIGGVSQYNISISEYHGHGVGPDVEHEGTPGADEMNSDGRDGSLDGGDGDDNFTLTGGNVEIEGGNGDDLVTSFRSLGDYERSLVDGQLVLTASSIEVASLHHVERIYSIADDEAYSVADLLTQFGSAGHDDIAGTKVRDVITGQAGDDTISAGGGSDLIDGGEGADEMAGGAGDDHYQVDDVGDVVIENADEGWDVVQSSVSYSLGANVEDLQLRSDVATDGVGNELNNWLGGDGHANLLVGLAGDDSMLGDAGDDTLIGGDGYDYLVGNEGEDCFVFDTALGAGNIDWIVDFEGGSDRIALYSTVFTGLSAGPLSASAFVIGTAAADSGDRIIFDDTTGTLWFDADGTGTGAAVEFAWLISLPSLNAGDFLVI